MGFFANLLTGSSAGPIIGLIDKLIPDKGAADAAKLKLLELQQAGELAALDADLQLAMGQIDVNKAEAASGSGFASNWRPAVGWICAFALAYQMIVRPLLSWVSVIYSWMPPPSLELDTLLTLLFGMLGLGAMRTAEKFKGVAK